MNLSELRKKYPQYSDLGDQDFADKFHAKYYSDIPKDDFYSKIGLITNQPQQQEDHHPILETIAEKIQGIPGLQQAGNIAGRFNNIVEGTGIPSLAKGFLNTGIEAGRGLTNLIPGVDIKKQKFPQLHVNPYVGEGSEVLGSFGMGLPIYKGYQAAKAGLNLLPGANKIPAALKNILAGTATGAAISPEDRLLGGALGGIVESLPQVVKGAKKAYQYIREPGKLLNESQETLQAIKHLLSQHQQGAETAQTAMSHFLNQVQEGLSNQQSNLESRLPELFPIQEKALTKKNLNSATKDAVMNLSENFNKRYNDYYNQEGQKPIKDPFEWRDIKVDNLPHVSMTTRKMGYGVSNDQIHYENSDGTKVNIQFPAENATVKDYIDFSRELRDAAWDASKAAKRATYGESKELRKTSNRLRQLQGEAEEKIKNSVSEESYNQYRKIQEDYSNLMGPIKTEPTLFNAVYKKKISDKLHSTLLQPANEHIREYLYKSPEFTRALRNHLMQGSNHPLSNGPMINPASIDYDVRHLLSPEQIAAQNEGARLNQAQQHLNQVSNHIQTPETLTPMQEQQVRQFHPRTAHHLNEEAERRHIVRELEHQKSEHTMTKEDLERVLKNRRIKTTIGLLGAGSIFGPDIKRYLSKLF